MSHYLPQPATIKKGKTVIFAKIMKLIVKEYGSNNYNYNHLRKIRSKIIRKMNKAKWLQTKSS